jgi:hypothetical protein
MPSVSIMCVTLCGTELTLYLTSECVRASKYTKSNEIYILLPTENAGKNQNTL